MVRTQDSRSSLAERDVAPATDGLQPELAGRLERCIERMAAGRIRELRVVFQDNAIVIEGWSRTYHAKQLAQEAVLDVTRGEFSLSNHIVVC